MPVRDRSTPGASVAGSVRRPYFARGARAMLVFPFCYERSHSSGGGLRPDHERTGALPPWNLKDLRGAEFDKRQLGLL
jgi:hypothetical protein